MVCEINGSSMLKCLICRDVLGTAPDVPAGSKLAVTYTISTQFLDDEYHNRHNFISYRRTFSVRLFAFGLAVSIGLMRDTYKKEQGNIAAQVLIGAAVPYAYMLLRGQNERQYFELFR